MTQLKAFYEVARHGSFTAAAHAVNLTQPGLSGHVRALEDTYGVELFLRQTRSLSLTEIGQELFFVAEKIFRLSDEAEARLKMVASSISGVLRVGSDNPYRSIPCLADFSSEYSQVDLDLKFGNGAQVLDDLRNCVVDIAFLAQADGLSGLHAVQRGRQPIDVVVGENHPWKNRRSIKLDQLDGQVLLRREKGSKTQDAVDRLFRKKKIKANFSMEISGREALREAIANGLGIGLICRAEHGHDPRLRALEIRGESLFLTEYVACLSTRKEALLIKHAMSFSAQDNNEPVRI